MPALLLRDKRSFAALEGQTPRDNPAAIRIAGHIELGMTRPTRQVSALCPSPRPVVATNVAGWGARGASLPSPALSECRHRSLARRCV